MKARAGVARARRGGGQLLEVLGSAGGDVLLELDDHPPQEGAFAVAAQLDVKVYLRAMTMQIGFG
jgi:hypothetical protein